jgi:predicted TIM-barrel fold metal-dependent hydrolase
LVPLVPRVVAVEQGDAWIVHPDVAPRPVTTSAVAGVKYEEYLKKPVTYKEMRPGSFDPMARLEDMDIDGVDAEVLYPGIARALDLAYDPEVRLFCAQAYNDWLAEFQCVRPDRFVGLAVLPPVEDETSTEELERAIGLGFRGAFLSTPVGGRPLSHPSADALWAVAEGHRIPISLHIGAGRAVLQAGALSTEDAALPGVREAFASCGPMTINEHMAVLVFSGVFSRFPGLKVVIAESGIGWMPYFIERMESVYERHRHYLHTVEARHPAEVFHEHLFATFQEDRAGVRLRDLLGLENIMWASDYPHTDTTWPESTNVVKRDFADVPLEERAMILARNCVQLYRLSEQPESPSVSHTAP